MRCRCRYCWCKDSLSTLIAPCDCTGSMKYVHPSCLTHWLLQKDDQDTCEICKTRLRFTVPLPCNLILLLVLCWLYMLTVLFVPYFYVYLLLPNKNVILYSITHRTVHLTQTSKKTCTQSWMVRNWSAALGVEWAPKQWSRCLLLGRSRKTSTCSYSR